MLALGRKWRQCQARGSAFSSVDLRAGDGGEVAFALFNHLGESNIELIDELLAVRSELQVPL
jgi:hypothetical protein